MTLLDMKDQKSSEGNKNWKRIPQTNAIPQSSQWWWLMRSIESLQILKQKWQLHIPRHPSIMILDFRCLKVDLFIEYGLRSSTVCFFFFIRKIDHEAHYYLVMEYTSIYLFFWCSMHCRLLTLKMDITIIIRIIIVISYYINWIL